MQPNPEFFSVIHSSPSIPNQKIRQMGGVSFKKSWGDGKATGGDVSETTSSATPRQRLGVDTMDLHDRGHSVPGVLVGDGGFDWKRSKTREVGTIRHSGRYCGAIPNAQQLPNKSLRSNARNAVTGKSLAKCEKPLISVHFGEHC